MPYGDGTGPEGNGPVGRGRRPCKRGNGRGRWSSGSDISKEEQMEMLKRRLENLEKRKQETEEQLRKLESAE